MRTNYRHSTRVSRNDLPKLDPVDYINLLTANLTDNSINMILDDLKLKFSYLNICPLNMKVCKLPTNISYSRVISTNALTASSISLVMQFLKPNVLFELGYKLICLLINLCVSDIVRYSFFLFLII